VRLVEHLPTPHHPAVSESSAPTAAVLLQSGSSCTLTGCATSDTAHIAQIAVCELARRCGTAAQVPRVESEAAGQAKATMEYLVRAA
jgi:hypothetical protein